MKKVLIAGACLAFAACAPPLESASDAGDPGTDAGTDAGTPSYQTPPMPRLSKGIPVFASSANFGAVATNANDDSPTSAWEPSSIPAWIAYDLSGIAPNQRANALLAWYAPRTQDYVDDPPQAWQEIPVDYTVETNTAPGGTASPPSSGWVQAAAVTANARNARQHLLSLGSVNWVRMNVTKGSDPSKVAIDVDIHGAPSGAGDTWLFMGDSITAMTLSRPYSDLPWLVATAKPGWFPAIVAAGIGGTNTVSALPVIDATMSTFAGRFVVLGYGTNDDPNNFQMEALVLKVIAAGKVPVIPHVPWSDTMLTKGPIFNAAIDALYAKYPQILRGPDLWAFFTNRTDLIPSGDVHPNAAGQEALRKQWAALIASLDR